MKSTMELGAIQMTGELLGVHVHVTARGAGQEGHRPLLGHLTMSVAEWQSLCECSTAVAAAETYGSMLRKIAEISNVGSSDF